MSDILRLALKEFRDGLRNRWVAATIALLATLSLLLVAIGQSPSGGVAADPLALTVVSLSSLSVYLLPLIALLLAHDAFAGELERGTLLLLLSYPVARWQIVLGKLLGHLSILTLAIFAGFGAAALAHVLGGETGRAGWLAFAALCASSVLLGAVFIAVGYALSAAVDERAKAAGLAIALWLLFVVLYDLALLGILLADERQALGQELFAAALLLNPTDAFRIFNLTLIEDVRGAAGLAGLAAERFAAAPAALVSLAAWIFAPLGLSLMLFSRREL